MEGPRYKKSLGQHHLVSGALCAPLVAFLRPGGRRVVEIGPGGGVLTAELLEAGARRVVAWELDLPWAAELARRHPEWRHPGGHLSDGHPLDGQGSGGRLQVVVGDALELDWPSLAAPGTVLAAGNLPYNVATPILERLLPHHRAVPRAAFLVQWEVGERLVAGPGDPAYGSLSVLVAAHAEARLLGRVKRGAFRPPPKVDGAFVGLALRPPPLPPAEMPAFLATVRLAFSQRRKTLRNALASGVGKERAGRVVEAFVAGRPELPPTVRAEILGVPDFLELHHLLSNGV